MNEKHRAEKSKIKVAVYCRVANDEQLSEPALELQRRQCEERIAQATEWAMAGYFADIGCASPSDRPGFQRLLHQCQQRKIDLILTTSLSRISHDTGECLSVLQHLQKQGIGVYCEKEQINTLDGKNPMNTFRQDITPKFTQEMR